MRQQHAYRGFTLIEMSIVIVLVAAIIGAVAVIFSSLLKQFQYEETQAKLTAIQTALYEYRVAFNTLPCPADITLAIGHTHFGVAAQNPGSCTGGIPAANFSGSDGTPQEARVGMVPTQTLHLPDEYAFDGWGRRILYAVNRDLTQVGAFSIVVGYDPTPRITILNDQGVPNTALAGYVLVSHGANGHGAYPRKGGVTRVDSGSVNAQELDNCDCDSATAATGMNNEFVQKDSSLNPANLLDAYDDLVVYGTRVDMILKSSMAWSLGPQYTFKPSGAESETCFPAGTQITTPQGDTPIETLMPGDDVLAVDAQGKPITVKVRVFMAKRGQVLAVETDGGTLRTTADHPLMMADFSYRKAGELKTGDRVMQWKNGKPEPVHVQALTPEAEETVYNLEVDEPHSFIADGFVVHNKVVQIY